MLMVYETVGRKKLLINRRWSMATFSHAGGVFLDLVHRENTANIVYVLC